MSPRLDQALFDRGLVRSRNQGREFILAGQVCVDGVVQCKPSFQVVSGSELKLLATAHRHRVGRGYDKLSGFLSTQTLDFTGRRVVDGGASSGGFTQLALELGAEQVLAVELGRDQLDPELSDHPSVISREGCDLRDLSDLPAPCDILLLDLSFISLLEVLPQLSLPLAADASLVALVKPQFELPSQLLTAAGRPRKARDAESALAAVLDCARDSGWTILATAPVEPGPDQRNREFFILARRTRREAQ